MYSYSSLTAYVVLFAVCFILGMYYFSNDNSVFKDVSYISNQERNVFKTDSANVLVYLTSPSCGYCNNESHINDIIKAKDIMRKRSSEDSINVATISVVISRSIDNAIDHISKFGSFDEISCGRIWYNSALDTYLWNKFPGEPIVPQLIIIRASYDSTGDAISKDRIIENRLKGAKVIEKWVKGNSYVL